jgi:hypothetical protein
MGGGEENYNPAPDKKHIAIWHLLIAQNSISTVAY